LRVAVLLCAAAASAQVVTTQFTARLTDSGSDAPLAVPADAMPAGVGAPLHVGTPNAQAPRILNFVSPAIAIPYDSPIRQVEAFWNGTPLPLIDPSRSSPSPQSRPARGRWRSAASTPVTHSSPACRSRT